MSSDSSGIGLGTTASARRDIASTTRPKPTRWGKTRAPGARQTVAFVASGTIAAILALRGGSYDIVERQELGVLIWFLLALGLGFGLLPNARPARIAFVPIAALGLLAAWTTVSLDWTASDERTLAEVTRVATYAGILLLVVLVVDRHSWRSAAAGLAAGALLVAILATTSRITPDLFPADRARSVGVGRLNYPFGYWNAVGAWGAMAVCAGLAWSAGAARLWQRVPYLAALPAAGLSVYLSYSRGSLGGLLVGVALAIALSRARVVALVHAVGAAVLCAGVIAVVRGYPELARGESTDGAVVVALALVLASGAAGGIAALTGRRLCERSFELRIPHRRVVAAVAAGTLLIALVAAGPTLANRAWESFKRPTDWSTTADPAKRLSHLHGERYPLWSAALDEFVERPWRGTGAGTFEFTLNRRGDSPISVRDAHSLYLEQLSELGWPGAALTLMFLASLLVVVVQAVRKARRSHTQAATAASLAVVGVWLVQLGVDWVWEITAVAVLALAAAALAWARLGDYGTPAALSLPFRLSAAAGCILVSALFVPGIASNSLVRDSQASARDADLGRAARKADSAVAAEPWAVTPLLQRAAVAEAAGRLSAARTDVRRAAEREPWNWRPPLMLARVEAAIGRPVEALRQLRRARSLRRGQAFEASGRDD